MKQDDALAQKGAFFPSPIYGHAFEANRTLIRFIEESKYAQDRAFTRPIGSDQHMEDSGSYGEFVD